MSIWPVIVRELGTQARQPFTCWLRVLGAGAMLAVAALTTVSGTYRPDSGSVLFGALHRTLFGAIWLLVPLLTADCLSRERREGTLALLFLTPLKARHIVVAKALVHGLRATTMVLAALPILTIPFLLGGVGWKEAVMSCLVNGASLCLALASGIWVSSWNRSAVRALGWTALCTAAALAFLLIAFPIAFVVAIKPFVPLLSWSLFWNELATAAAVVVWDVDGEWSHNLARLPGPAHWTWLAALATVALLSLLLLTLATALAAWHIRRDWQEQPPPAWRRWLQDTFCTPTFAVSLFRRWMRHKLECNPIGWLETRTWTSRLVTWSWLAVMISFLTVELGGQAIGRGELKQMLDVLAWALMVGMASASAVSFRRERESGVLELLLVSPVRERQIIGGRLRGIWGQFLPAMGLWVSTWLYLQSVPYTSQWLSEETGGERLWVHVCTFFALPVIGLYFSLARRSFFGAFVFTLLSGMLLPTVLTHALVALTRLLKLTRTPYGSSPWALLFQFEPDNPPAFIAALLFAMAQIVVAAFLWRRLYQKLATRGFALERPVT